MGFAEQRGVANIALAGVTRRGFLTFYSLRRGFPSPAKFAIDSGFSFEGDAAASLLEIPGVRRARRRPWRRR